MLLKIQIQFLLIFSALLLFTKNNALAVEQTDSIITEFHKESFVNINAVSKERAIKIRWGIAYDSYEFAKKNNYSIVIRFAKKDDLKHNSNAWNVVKEQIALNQTRFLLENLDHNEEYTYSIGVKTDSEIVWSNEFSERTLLPWGFFKFIVLIGALGLFIYGMKVMSEGLQQVLGAKLRNQLGSIASNQFRGVLAGFSITSIIQSSTITNVMTVSFVNAGILTLRQSAGVMMGANIGTTIKAWFINLLAFEVDLSIYALFILAIAAPLLFFGKKRWKPWINSIFGFVFLFMGLGFMVETIPSDIQDIPLLSHLLSLKGIPVVGVLIFTLLGVLITVVMQSSSATLALIMVFVSGGLFTFDVAIAMMLGANVGSVIAVEMASAKGNVHARRSARIQTLFNAGGFIWALLLFPFILQAIQYFMIQVGWGDPINDPIDYANSGLALFHTVFNVVNTLIFIWFIPQLVSFAEKTVKSKKASDEKFHLEFIGAGFLSTADLSILEAKKEIAKFGSLTQRMSRMTRSLLFEKNPKQFELVLKRIRKYEDITDKIEVEVVKYLRKLGEGDLTSHTVERIRGMNKMVNDLERIGDIYYQMSKTINRKVAEKLWFTPEQRNNISEMFDVVDEALVIMCENLSVSHEKVRLDKAIEAEKKINQKRNELRTNYLAEISNQDPNFKAGMIYNDLFSSLEKVGDHIINVSEAIVGKV